MTSFSAKRSSDEIILESLTMSKRMCIDSYNSDGYSVQATLGDTEEEVLSGDSEINKLFETSDDDSSDTDSFVNDEEESVIDVSDDESVLDEDSSDSDSDDLELSDSEVEEQGESSSDGYESDESESDDYDNNE